MQKLGDLTDMEVMVTQSLSEAAGYWQTLQRHDAPSPFQTLEMAESYLASAAALGHQSSVLLLIGLRNGEPVLLFPFEVISGRLAKRVTWLGQQVADYGQPLVHSSVTAHTVSQFLGFATRRLRELEYEVDNVALARIPPALNGHGASWTGSGLVREAEISSHALRFEGSWTHQYPKLRSTRSRQRLRSKWAGLKRSGSVRFGRIKPVGLRLRAADMILSWKSVQLAEARKRNPFAGPHSILRETARAAVASGQAEVIGLELDGRLLAGSLVFRSRSTMYLWICAYDPQSDSRFSPGTLQLIKSLELASRAGMQRYDFLVGDEDYKNDWCNEHISLVHYFAGLTWRGKLDNAVLLSLLAIKRFLLQSPRLKRAAERLLHEYKSRFSSSASLAQPSNGTQNSDVPASVTRQRIKRIESAVR